MNPFRPSRSDNHLSTYWNALVRHAPAGEIARLAANVEPSELAAIHRARAAHLRYEPDPVFALRLEQTLMDTAISPIAGTIPQPRVSPPHTNGPHDRGRIRSAPDFSRPRWGGTLIPALEIGLIILLILASIAGIWLANDRQDEPQVIVPPVATPTVESTPGWTNERGDPARRGEADAGPVDQPIELWRFQASGSCALTPAVVGDTLFVACRDGQLYALDTGTGEVQWQFAATSWVDGPAVSGGLVYAFDGNNILHALDAATGDEAWRFDTFPVFGSPVVDDGILVVQDEAGQLIGLDAATGGELWRAPLSSGEKTGRPALAGGVAYIGNDAGVFSAVDMSTGEVLWQVDTGDEAIGYAVVADGIAYAGPTLSSPNGVLSALDAQTGELVWQSTAATVAPAVSGGVGYSGNADGIVVAHVTATGEERWRTQVGGVIRSVIVADGIVYVPSDGEHTISALDTETGDILWQVPVDGNFEGSAVVAGGVIYIATMNGVVQAFGEAGIAGVASTPIDTPVSATPAIATPAASPPTSEVATPVSTPAGLPASTSQLDSEFDRDSTLVEVWSIGGIELPGKIAIDPDGNIWVVDGALGTFRIIDPNGNLVESWGEPGTGEGQFNFQRGNGDPYGEIAFGADGSFYVLDPGNNRVQAFDRNRTFTTAWGSFGNGEGQFIDPAGIAVAPDGTVWVVDDSRNLALHFDHDGEPLGSFEIFADGGGFNRINDLAVDATGNLYVTDINQYQVLVFHPDGKLIGTLGESATSTGGFRGQSGVIAFTGSGQVLVTDLIVEGGGMGALHVFDPYGTAVVSITTLPPIAFGIALDSGGDLYLSSMTSGTLTRYSVSDSGVSPEATPIATPAG